VLLVAPFRPLWWVGRPVLRLMTCAAIAATLWGGLQAVGATEPTKIESSHITRVAASSAVGRESMTQFVATTRGAAFVVALGVVPAAPFLPAPLQGRLPDGPGRHRAPPRR